MEPYFGFPFTYYDRNEAAMNPSADMPAEYSMPQQPTSPMMNPYMQQAMPMCPFMQPMMSQNQPMVPMFPQQESTQMPGYGNFGTLFNQMGIDIDRPTVSDPPPILSNNPPITRLVLFKELTGYPNYGNPSGNADILYTGNRGTWTFEIPQPLLASGNYRAQIIIRGVLDDHYDVPANRYSATITVNGTNVHTGRVPLAHGEPRGSRFNNWRELTFNATPRRNNRVVIVNTSNAGPDDWIGFDWMELRLLPR